MRYRSNGRWTCAFPAPWSGVRIGGAFFATVMDVMREAGLALAPSWGRAPCACRPQSTPKLLHPTWICW
jgi:hypothetical protein